MGNRLSKIYTRTGDDGTTGLGDGSRVHKDDSRVEAYGTVDELNSSIGMILAEDIVPDAIRNHLATVQHDLFDLGSELCVPGYEAIQQSHIDYLETQLDDLNQHLPPLKEFILPGGNRAASCCHLARTICRRAERRVHSLHKADTVNPLGLQYLNRLSDYLFVAARSLSRVDNGTEVLWDRKRLNSSNG